MISEQREARLAGVRFHPSPWETEQGTQQPPPPPHPLLTTNSEATDLMQNKQVIKKLYTVKYSVLNQCLQSIYGSYWTHIFSVKVELTLNILLCMAAVKA